MSSIYQRGATWYYQVEDADRAAAGEPVKRRFSLHTDDERAARTLQSRADYLHATGAWDPWDEDLIYAVKARERSERQKELAILGRAASAEERGTVALAEAIRAFTARTDLKAGTRRSYKAVLDLLLKEVDLDEATGLPNKLSVGRWLRSGSEGRQATYARTLRSFEKWAREQGYVPGDAETFVPPTKAKNSGRLVFFTPQEHAAILARIAEHASVEHRLWLEPIVRTAVYTGLRLAEHAEARVEWFDASNQRLVIPATNAKSKKDDVVYVPLAAAEVLAEQVERSRSGHLFELGGGAFSPGHLSNMFRDYKDAAGVDKGNFHTLRHTCASWLAQGGAPAYAIQRHMRHARIETTMRYMHLGPQHQEALIEQAFEKHDQLYGAAD